MLDFVYCELLKFKRTGYISFGIAFVIMWSPGLLFANPPSGQGAWYRMFYQYENIAFGILYPIIITILVSLIFTRDVRNDTASVMFTYPTGRKGMILNKLITGAILIGVIYIASFIGIVLGGMIFIKSPMDFGAILNHGKVFIASWSLQIVIMPMTALVSLLFGNITVSFFYAMFLLIANFSYVVGGMCKDIAFSILPVIINLNTPSSMIDKPLKIVISDYHIILGMCVFTIGLIGCLIYSRKANIN
ncbi:ABC transporter permease [Oceanirhabdus seepicola]|uniref:ABC transporter permease n=1 Tax=Oceanirhabdus seepicola TaxID=2828781 RepID=A0A9J6P8D1_9CLOT|nr:ABC transporter permease [Oceanirhabdus seepicola]